MARPHAANGMHEFHTWQVLNFTDRMSDTEEIASVSMFSPSTNERKTTLLPSFWSRQCLIALGGSEGTCMLFTADEKAEANTVKLQVDSATH